MTSGKSEHYRNEAFVEVKKFKKCRGREQERELRVLKLEQVVCKNKF